MGRSPMLMPSPRKVARQVYLDAAWWDELTQAAQFHTDAFEEFGAYQKVSRNDLLEVLIRWALDAYWEDKGGRSQVGTPEYKKRVAEFAEHLKKQHPKK